MFTVPFDSSEPYRCPIGNPAPEICSCSSCYKAREHAKSHAALGRAVAKSFAPTGSLIPVEQTVSEFERIRETPREKIERHRGERIKQSEESWAYIQANQSQYAEQRAKTLRQRKATFELSRAQSPVTQSQNELRTSEEQKQSVKHLNELDGALDYPLGPKSVPKLGPMKIMSKNSVIYHGTKWEPSEPKWWRGTSNPYPNKVGEDGGISYSLDKYSSPKLRNAKVVVEYELTKDLPYIECSHKCEFRRVLNDNPTVLAVWTKHENELVIRNIVQGACLKYKTDS